MPDKLVTRGLVLRATETKEADYILTVLTAEHGRLAVIARGARRRSSKLAAACQHLAFSELVLYRRGSWHYLDEASTIALFDGLRADLEKLSLASYFAEMAEAVTSEDLPSGEVLSLLLNSLYALDTLDRPNELPPSSCACSRSPAMSRCSTTAPCAAGPIPSSRCSTRRRAWCCAKRARDRQAVCRSTRERSPRCATSSAPRPNDCCRSRLSLPRSRA